MIQNLLLSTFQTAGIPNSVSFRSLSYDTCLSEFGSDKPDLRIPYRITSISDDLQKIRVLRFPGLAPLVSASKLKQLLKSLEEGQFQKSRVLRVGRKRGKCCVVCGGWSGETEYSRECIEIGGCGETGESILGIAGKRANFGGRGAKRKRGECKWVPNRVFIGSLTNKTV